MDETETPHAQDIHSALQQAAHQLQAELQDLFGHEDAQVRVLEGEGLRLEATGGAGRFQVHWPPGEQLTQVEGELGEHARIAFELLLASETPEAFFGKHRPASPERRKLAFERLRWYVEDSLGENPYYSPLLIEQRGPVMLVYSDGDYALICEDGGYKGEGILLWKVRRLMAYALTDADEELFGDPS